jgi:predicted P-loop ATPase
MPGDVVPIRPESAEEHAQAETTRKQLLFAWLDQALVELGLAERVRQANALAELARIAFDENAGDVELLIRDALRPENGARAAHFVGLDKKALKRLLKKWFTELKKDRMAELRNGTAGSAGGQPAYDWTNDIKFDDKTGNVKPILHNLILYLCEHPKWKGVVGFDEFKNQVVIRKPLPWGAEAHDASWADQHETLTRRWFETEDIVATLGNVGRAVQAAARANTFHPVRDYFDALVWDRVPRLDAWFITYLNADDTPYARAVGPRFLISAAARISDPGCKVDHMPVLEGPQGKQKTEALRTLTPRPEWFSDQLSELGGSRHTAMGTAGKLLFEMPEMAAYLKASSATSKSFLTRRSDRYLRPWGKHLVDLPRQCVFAGTINPPAGGYLKDPTGSRRIWPVLCHGVIDLDALERDRDQLWAEAVARYRAGAKWWLETPDLEALATAEQELRFKSDVWTERVTKWLGRKKDTSLSEVLTGALKIPLQDQNQTAQNRVVDILTNLHFRKYRRNKRGIRENRYRRP